MAENNFDAACVCDGDGKPLERRDLDKAESRDCSRRVEGKVMCFQELRERGFKSLQGGRDLPIRLTNILNAT